MMGGKDTRYLGSISDSASDSVCDFGHELSPVWAAVVK